MPTENPLRPLTQLLLFGVAVLAAGCIAVSPHQTGRTLGKGGISASGSYNFGMANEGQVFRIKEDIEAADKSNQVQVHLVEVGVQAALNERLDCGLRLNNTGHFTLHLKGQIIGSKQSLVASSLGAEAGVNAFGLLSTLAGYHVALSSFNSLHLTDYLALGFSPRYVFVNVDNYGPINLKYNTSMLGYSVGLFAGRKHMFSIEFSQYAIDLPYRISHAPMLSAGLCLRIQ